MGKMKCIKCNAEIEQEAQFCPYCGTKVVYTRCCTKCGKPLDEDSDFCPYCGTKQDSVNTESELIEEVVQPQKTKSVQELETVDPSKNQIEELPQVSKNGSKKWLWIGCAILGLCFSIGGVLYFSSDNNSNDSGDTSFLSKLSKDSATDSLENRLNEIYTKIYGVNGHYDYSESENYDLWFCTSDYKDCKFQFEEWFAKSTADNGIHDPDYDHWSGFGNGYGESFEWKIVEAKVMPNDSAIAKIQITNKGNNETSKLLVKLANNGNDWFIDDFILESGYGYSEKEKYWNDLNTLWKNPSKYNFPEFGEEYKMKENCLSYKQMKSIAKNELPVNEIDLFALYRHFKTDDTNELREYQTPLYYSMGAYFEVHISTVNGRNYYNFYCKCNDNNDEYFEKLCADLKEDTEDIETLGSGFRGFPIGFKYAEIVRDGVYIYVHFQL